MRLFSTTLILAALLLPIRAEEEEKRGITKLLTAGSVLSDLRIPNYSPEGTLSSVTTIEHVTVFSDYEALGKNISLSLYQDDGSPGTHLQLNTATFDTRTSVIQSDQPLVLTDASGQLTASGIYVRMTTRQAFLSGPCTNTIFLKRPAPPQAARNTPHLILKASATPASLIASCLAAFHTSALAIIPGALSDQQLEEIENSVSTDLTSFSDQENRSLEALNRASLDSQAIDERLSLFRKELAIPVQATGAQTTHPAPREDVETPDIEASCQDGIYIDPDSDAIVYVNDVTFKYHPKGMVLKAKKEVKALLLRQKNTGEPASEEKQKLFDQFNGLKSVTASGGIDVTITLNDGSTARATGETLFYNHLKEEVIIRGGFPFFSKPGLSMAATKEDQYIIVPLKTLKLVAPGQWKQKADLKQLKN